MTQKYSRQLNLGEIPYYRFQASIGENKFMEIFENVRKFQSQKNTKTAYQDESGGVRVNTTNSDSKNELYLDFILKFPGKKRYETKRIQFDVFSHKAHVEKKQNIEFADVMHNGLDYRVSVAFESREPCDLGELMGLDTAKIDCVRVKSRRSWGFQFMSIDLTTSFLLERKKFKYFPKFCQLFFNYLGKTSTGRLLVCLVFR